MMDWQTKLILGELPELPATEDVDRTFDKFREQLELEMAGGPALPAKGTRLRSHRDGNGEQFEKFVGSTPASRRVEAVHEYLLRRRAAGATVDSTMAELIATLRGENE